VAPSGDCARIIVTPYPAAESAQITQIINIRHSPGGGTTFQTPFSPVSFGKSFMKIRSAVPENGCLIFFWWTENKNKKNIYKTYTLPLHRRLRK